MKIVKAQYGDTPENFLKNVELSMEQNFIHLREDLDYKTYQQVHDEGLVTRQGIEFEDTDSIFVEMDIVNLENPQHTTTAYIATTEVYLSVLEREFNEESNYYNDFSNLCDSINSINAEINEVEIDLDRFGEFMDEEEKHEKQQEIKSKFDEIKLKLENFEINCYEYNEPIKLNNSFIEKTNEYMVDNYAFNNFNVVDFMRTNIKNELAELDYSQSDCSFINLKGGDTPENFLKNAVK